MTATVFCDEFLPMVISPPVASLQPKVSSLHNRSHLAPYKSYFPSDKSYFSSYKSYFPSDKSYFPSYKSYFPSYKSYFSSYKSYFPSDKSYFSSYKSYFPLYKSYFTPCKKLVKCCHELFVLMLELDWFWTYVSSDLLTNAVSKVTGGEMIMGWSDWIPLWPTTVQTHCNMESFCFTK